jgi:hypothetical protein
MKKRIILVLIFIALTINIQANEKNKYLFELNKQIYTLNNFKVPKYNFKEHYYSENINTIKKFAKHKELYEEAILNSTEYIKNKKEFETAYKKYEEKKGEKLTEVEKIEIAIYLWRNIKFKNYKISEKIIKKYYDENIEEFTFPPAINAYFLMCNTLEEYKDILEKLRYTSNKRTMFYKLLKKEYTKQKFVDLGWRSETNYLKTFKNPDIFKYLWSLKPGELTEKEIYLPKKQKYAIFMLLGKKDSFKQKYKEAKKRIKNKLKNQLFLRDYSNLNIIKYDLKINKKYIKELSK